MKYVTAYVTKSPPIYVITFKAKAGNDTTWVCRDELVYAAAMGELQQIESVEIVSHGQKHFVVALPHPPLSPDLWLSIPDAISAVGQPRENDDE